MESIGERIYSLRKGKGVSQERLAQELGVARFTVSRWETGAVQPTTENIMALCEFFGVESNYFFDTAIAKDGAEKPSKTEKEHKYSTLKIVLFVAGMVLLAFLVAVCGIASYIAITPGSGADWGEDIHIVNYEGIIYLVVGAVSVALLITLTVISVIKFRKPKKTEN